MKAIAQHFHVVLITTFHGRICIYYRYHISVSSFSVLFY